MAWYSKILDRWRDADGFVTAAGWIWWGAERIFYMVFGLSGAALVAWAFAQLHWFWDTFQWAGVLFIGLVTWFIIGAGINLYRQERTGGRRSMDPWLAGAGIAALALVGCLAGFALNGGGSQLSAHVATNNTLSDEDRRFRDNMRRLILTDLLDMHQKLGGVTGTLRNVYATVDKEKSPAISLLSSLATRPINEKFDLLQKNANVPIELMDSQRIQEQLKEYLMLHNETQNIIGDMAKLTGVDPNTNNIATAWIDADRRFFRSFRELRLYPMATGLPSGLEGFTAVGREPWVSR